LENYFWEGSFWVDGYFSEPVGKADEEVVKKYIRQQSGNP
jgi:REP element-mobilizing transposase RayT